MKKTALYVFFIAIFTIFFLPPIDTDLGWHFRYGNYFLNYGRPMTENKITVLLHNQPWPNSYTLYQPLISIIYRLFGFWGLSILNSIIITISFYFIWLLFNKNLTKTTLTGLITTIGGWSILQYGLRGQVTSVLFLSLLFYILIKVKNSTKKTFWLGLLFLFWANFHGSYFYGILLTCLWALLNLKPIIILPVIITPLFNPYGFDNYKHVFVTMTAPLNTMIAEWTPPSLNLKFISIIFFSLYLFIWTKKSKKTLSKFFWPISTLSALYLVLNARRNLPQFFLIQSLAFFMTVNVKKNSAYLVNIFWSAIVILFLIIQIPQTIKINSNFNNFCREGMTSYPCQAIDFIKTNQLKGSIFNFYRWGGFLTWQLPDNLIFVAGHIPAYQLESGKYPYQFHLEILQARPGYQEKLNKYNIDYILIPPKTFLDLEIQKNKDAPWREIYRNEISVLYKRLD